MVFFLYFSEDPAERQAWRLILKKCDKTTLKFPRTVKSFRLKPYDNVKPIKEQNARRSRLFSWTLDLQSNEERKADFF